MYEHTVEAIVLVTAVLVHWMDRPLLDLRLAFLSRLASVEIRRVVSTVQQEGNWQDDLLYDYERATLGYNIVCQ